MNNLSNLLLLITISYIITFILEMRIVKQLKRIETCIFFGIHVTIMSIFVIQYLNIEIPVPVDFFIHIVSPWISSWMGLN